MPDDTALCPICEGRGFLGYEVEVGHPQFGEITPCPACQGQPADYTAPPPRPPLSGPDAIDFSVSPDWQLHYYRMGLTPYPPVSQAPTGEEIRDRHWAQVERDYQAMGEPVAGPRPHRGLVPLAEVLRPVQVTIQERPKPTARPKRGGIKLV